MARKYDCSYYACEVVFYAVWNYYKNPDIKINESLISYSEDVDIAEVKSFDSECAYRFFGNKYKYVRIYICILKLMDSNFKKINSVMDIFSIAVHKKAIKDENSLRQFIRNNMLYLQSSV